MAAPGYDRPTPPAPFDLPTQNPNPRWPVAKIGAFKIFQHGGRRHPGFDTTGSNDKGSANRWKPYIRTKHGVNWTTGCQDTDIWNCLGCGPAAITWSVWSRDTGLDICAFVYKVHCNHTPILHRYGDTEPQLFWEHDLDTLGLRDVIVLMSWPWPFWKANLNKQL